MRNALRDVDAHSIGADATAALAFLRLMRALVRASRSGRYPFKMHDLCARVRRSFGDAVPRRRVAASRRGYSVEASRVAAATAWTSRRRFSADARVDQSRRLPFLEPDGRGPDAPEPKKAVPEALAATPAWLRPLLKNFGEKSLKKIAKEHNKQPIDPILAALLAEETDDEDHEDVRDAARRRAREGPNAMTDEEKMFKASREDAARKAGFDEPAEETAEEALLADVAKRARSDRRRLSELYPRRRPRRRRGRVLDGIATSSAAAAPRPVLEYSRLRRRGVAARLRRNASAAAAPRPRPRRTIHVSAAAAPRPRRGPALGLAGTSSL